MSTRRRESCIMSSRRARCSLLLLVPSVIVHEEFNVLSNPKHKDADKIKAQVHRPFVYDPRLA